PTCRRTSPRRSRRCVPITSASSTRGTPGRAVSSTRSSTRRTRVTSSRLRCAPPCRIRDRTSARSFYPHTLATHEHSQWGEGDGRVVRVASGQGFWGDWLEAPRRQVEGGPIDYLMLDYLAEVTMSILQKQKERDPAMGYARDFLGAVESVLPAVAERGVRIIANAGGVNPRACAAAVRA